MLPYDIHRCNGTTHPLCEGCRRTEPGRNEWQGKIAPEITTEGCENYIPPVITTTDNTGEK